MSDSGLLRVRVLNSFFLGRRLYKRGERFELGFLLENLADLLALNKVIIEAPRHPSGFCVLTRDLPEGSAFEIVEKDKLPREYFLRHWAIELDDAELNQVYNCGGCSKAFLSYKALMKHRSETGHKRPYRRRRKGLDEAKEAT